MKNIILTTALAFIISFGFAQEFNGNWSKDEVNMSLSQNDIYVTGTITTKAGSFSLEGKMDQGIAYVDIVDISENQKKQITHAKMKISGSKLRLDLENSEQASDYGLENSYFDKQ